MWTTQQLVDNNDYQQQQTLLKSSATTSSSSSSSSSDHNNNTITTNNTISTTTTTISNTTTLNSIVNNNTTLTTILLIDNDINIKSHSFNLLKLKFQNQQLGKLKWLQNRELKHYEYIPIEFSKDAYFVTNFIDRMNQNELPNRIYHPNSCYRKDYYNILSDELKTDFDIVLNYEISNSFNGRFGTGTTPSLSLFNKINRICNESSSDFNETKCIEWICRIANQNHEFVLNYKSELSFIDKLLNYSDDDNASLLLKCISSNYKVFRYIQTKVNEEIDNGQIDLEFILKCVNANIRILRCINPKCSIFNDKQLIIKIFKSMNRKIGKVDGPLIYRKLSNELRTDREVISWALEKGFTVLFYIDSVDLIKNDRDIVLQCVRTFGRGLRFASELLRNDREIVLEAVRNDGNALKDASKELQQDRELILESIRNDNTKFLLDAPNELLSNREFILECVKVNGMCFEHVPPIYQSDSEIINEAIKQNPFIIEYINNNDIMVDDSCKNIQLNAVLKLIETSPQSIHYFSEEFRTNYQELTYKSTLLHNGYWMEYSEDAYQQRINHAYYSAKIYSNSEVNYYRNLNKENLLWKDLEWTEWR